MPSKQLSIVGALLLAIGFAAGALSVAIMRPPVKVVQHPGQPPVVQANQADARQEQPAPRPAKGARPPLVAQPIPETKHADTKDVPQSLVEFIRERLEKSTDSGRWEEIQWEHHVGEIPDGRISELYLPIAVGGHAATLRFRSFNGQAWSRGWIAAAQYAPDHFDWCGKFDGAIVNPAFTIPSEKPIVRNDIEKAFQMMDQILIDKGLVDNPEPAPGVRQVRPDFNKAPLPQAGNPRK